MRRLASQGKLKWLDGGAGQLNAQAQLVRTYPEAGILIANNARHVPEANADADPDRAVSGHNVSSGAATLTLNGVCNS